MTLIERIEAASGPDRDPETQDLLRELNDLQTWCALLMPTIPKAREAWDLVQRTRIHIIESAAALRARGME